MLNHYTSFPTVVCDIRSQATPSSSRSDLHRQAIGLRITKKMMILGPGGFSAPQNPPPAYCPGAPRQ